MLGSLTRSPSSAALVAALGWLVLLVPMLALTASSIEEWEPLYIVATVIGVVAGVATMMALHGLLTVSSLGGGSWKTVALVVAALGLALLTVAFWSSMAWTALFSAASIVAAYRLRGTAPEMKVGSWAFYAAWPLGFGLFVALDAMQFGRVDEYGDYPWAAWIGMAVWCGLFAYGLFEYGRWLRTRA